jgi:hypothetical protein
MRRLGLTQTLSLPVVSSAVVMAKISARGQTGLKMLDWPLASYLLVREVLRFLAALAKIFLPLREDIHAQSYPRYALDALLLATSTFLARLALAPFCNQQS